MVCSSYDVLEKGCPSFEERLKMLEKVSAKVKRTIVRIQPYMCEVFDEVYNNLEKFKQAGAYGVIVEGMKFSKKKDGMVRVGFDFLYPYENIKKDFLKLKEKAHSIGLKIYAGENRIRALGDNLTCCGIDGLEGFIPNNFNLNNILNGKKPIPTKQQKEKNTGHCFRALEANTIGGNIVDKQSFAFNMLNIYKTKNKTIDKVMGVKK
jgi:hypothetical protein